MNSAVRLRPLGPLDRPRSEVVHGAPRAFVRVSPGPAGLFGPGALVAYQVQRRRRERLFVFRTLEVADRLAALVPGMRPQVRLLMGRRSAERVWLTRKLFAYLAKAHLEASALSNAFYLQAGVALGGRVPATRSCSPCSSVTEPDPLVQHGRLRDVVGSS